MKLQHIHIDVFSLKQVTDVYHLSQAELMKWTFSIVFLCCVLSFLLHKQQTVHISLIKVTPGYNLAKFEKRLKLKACG